MRVLEGPTYVDLRAKATPMVLYNEEENERCTAMLCELSRNHGDLSADERKLAELLALLIGDFEEEGRVASAAS